MSSAPAGTGRLAGIAARLPEGTTVADIGCDHGKLGELLLRERPELFLIASDVSAASLAKAEQRLTALFAPSRFSLRLGDGLGVLAGGEADVAVMAGLGGRTIRRILAQDAAKARTIPRLLMSPQSCSGELRRFLAEADYRIDAEWIIEDRGRFYPLILAAPGGAEPEEDPFWYEVGRLEKSDPVVQRYAAHLRKNTEKALRAAADAEPLRAERLRQHLGRLREEFG